VCRFDAIDTSYTINPFACEGCKVCYLCVNKFDINPEMTREIKQYCDEKHLIFVGEIPYDLDMVKAVVARMPVVTYSQCEASQRIHQIWRRVEQIL
jgi:MinD superfamily P-loop ATPase